MVEHGSLPRPLVSVILPVHNGERFLLQAVESVLRQSHRPVEIIIVDDGSTDGTAELAKTLGGEVRYLHQANAGPAAARNLGIRNAQGSLIAFIDADDLWPDEKLAMQLRCFESWPELDIVQGLIRRVRLPDPGKTHLDPVEFDATFIHSNLGSMVMKSAVFEAVGWFDESLKFHEDTDLWLRAIEAGMVILVQRRLSLIYRLHGRNITSGEDPRTMGLANIVRRSLDRRRTAAGEVARLAPLKYIRDLQAQREQAADHPQRWPLVSIVAYGAAAPAAVRNALASIRSQGYRPAELIVIGGQRGRSFEPDREAFVRVVEVEASGDLAGGLNAAIDEAHGELVAFLDLSGEWMAGKLHTQAAYLLARPEVGYVAGRSRQIIDPFAKYPRALLDALQLKRNLRDLLSTMMVRRSAWVEVGAFAAGLAGMEDADWLLRAHDRGYPKSILSDTLFRRYVDPASAMPRMDEMKAALIESVRSSVQRKRGAAPAAGKLDSR